MAVRVLMLLFSLFILLNIVILLVSFVCNVNLYRTHGKILFRGFCTFVLLIVVVYVILAILGLI